VNLLHNYYDEQLEWATVELYLSLGVTRIEAAAFVSMTAPLIYYRVKGIHRARMAAWWCPITCSPKSAGPRCDTVPVTAAEAMLRDLWRAERSRPTKRR